MHYLLTLVVTQAELVRQVADPISAWVPPILQTIALVAVSLGWWRATKNREAERAVEEDHRYHGVTQALGSLSTSVADLRIAMGGFVTVERHSDSMSKIHGRIDEVSKKIAIVLDRTERGTR